MSEEAARLRAALGNLAQAVEPGRAGQQDTVIQDTVIPAPDG